VPFVQFRFPVNCVRLNNRCEQNLLVLIYGLFTITLTRCAQSSSAMAAGDISHWTILLVPWTRPSCSSASSKTRPTDDGDENDDEDETVVHGKPAFGFFPHALGP
jgi:hypothetical protein